MREPDPHHAAGEQDADQRQKPIWSTVLWTTMAGLQEHAQLPHGASIPAKAEGSPWISLKIQ